MIDHFTRAQFESALPTHKVTGADLWTYRGFINNEHVYAVPVLNPHCLTLAILIRSSIGAGGENASAGEDSIRCWLVDGATDTPMAGKTSKYITRVVGWPQRMERTLRKLYRIGMKLEPCRGCKKLMRAGVVRKKDSPYLGQLFQKCRNAECKNGSFAWIELETQCQKTTA